MAQTVVGADGRTQRIDGLWRRRAYRPNPDCPVRSWTVYEPDGYPHRSFTLAVTASAVEQLATDPKATLAEVARAHRCDRRKAL